MCGTPVNPIELVPGRWVAPVCNACGDRFESDQAKDARLAKQRKIERLLKMSDFGERFAETTFATWLDRPKTETMLAEAKRMATDWPTQMGLALIGPPGIGKTHLAAAVCNQLRPRGVGCVMRSTPLLMSQLRQCFARKTSELELLEALFDCELLVLDDLGAEKASEWVAEQLFLVVDERYIAKRPVIITSNLPLLELAAKIGERTVDRLVEMCRVVLVEAPSYRTAMAKARNAGGQPWRKNGD